MKKLNQFTRKVTLFCFIFIKKRSKYKLQIKFSITKAKVKVSICIYTYIVYVFYSNWYLVFVFRKIDHENFIATSFNQISDNTCGTSILYPDSIELEKASLYGISRRRLPVSIIISPQNSFHEINNNKHLEV